MRMLVLLAIALVSFAGGMGAGWFVFVDLGYGAPQSAEQGGDPAPAPPPSLPSASAAYVNIGPLTVPVLGDSRVEQFVSLVVAIEVENASVAERVKAVAPRLTDAFLTALYGRIGAGGMFRNGMLDIAEAKKHLSAASRQVLGDKIAHDVLVQVVTQRPM